MLNQQQQQQQQQPTILLQPVQVLYQGFVMPPEMASNFSNLLDLNHYWMWDVFSDKTGFKPVSNELSSSDKTVRIPTSRKSKKAQFKDYFVSKADEVYTLLQKVMDKDRKMFKKTNKSAVTPGHIPLKPRAKFIGVSKNGNNWQSLIVINNSKVYMGTYKSQLEAATIFDFHSMIVHYKCAKVNYDYSANDLIDMIQIFKENDNEFEAIDFLKLRPEQI